jgi:hypothetical protein
MTAGPAIPEMSNFVVEPPNRLRFFALTFMRPFECTDVMLLPTPVCPSVMSWPAWRSMVSAE